jgi:hypothetical protein
LRRNTRCVLAITDEEFASLYPQITLGQE